MDGYYLNANTIQAEIKEQYMWKKRKKNEKFRNFLLLWVRFLFL